MRTTFSETRHFFYNHKWQYVDELVARFRDADESGGTLEEELYALSDANWNVTAVVENDGDVVERFNYTPYGKSTELDPDFTSYTGSDYNWTYRYTGRELDLETGLQLNRGGGMRVIWGGG